MASLRATPHSQQVCHLVPSAVAWNGRVTTTLDPSSRTFQMSKHKRSVSNSHRGFSWRRNTRHSSVLCMKALHSQRRRGNIPLSVILYASCGLRCNRIRQKSRSVLQRCQAVSRSSSTNQYRNEINLSSNTIPCAIPCATTPAPSLARSPPPPHHPPRQQQMISLRGLPYAVSN